MSHLEHLEIYERCEDSPSLQGYSLYFLNYVRIKDSRLPSWIFGIPDFLCGSQSVWIIFHSGSRFLVIQTTSSICIYLMLGGSLLNLEDYNSELAGDLNFDDGQAFYKFFHDEVGAIV